MEQERPAVRVVEFLMDRVHSTYKQYASRHRSLDLVAVNQSLLIISPVTECCHLAIGD